MYWMPMRADLRVAPPSAPLRDAVACPVRAVHVSATHRDPSWLHAAPIHSSTPWPHAAHTTAMWGEGRVREGGRGKGEERNGGDRKGGGGG